MVSIHQTTVEGAEDGPVEVDQLVPFHSGGLDIVFLLIKTLLARTTCFLGVSLSVPIADKWRRK